MAKVRLVSPYLQDEGAMWLKGNLHVHTTRSDGKSEPQEMIRTYAELGYDFLGLSDHDVFGDVRGLDPCGMVLLTGNEVAGGSAHMLDVGAKRAVEPGGDRQAVIDRIAKQSGFAVLCHPSWEENFNHYKFETMLSLEHYVGIEIFNGVVIDMPGSHLATDKWDRLLGAGKVVWGFANDDAHRIAQVRRGWNVVRVRERSAKAILKALRAGSFYCSSGVEIERIEVNGPELHVRAPNADAIIVWGNLGTRVHQLDGGELRFDASGVGGAYIRVECLGARGAAAWTQPFFIRGGVLDRLKAKFTRLDGIEKPTLHAYRATRAPKLTGRIDDPLWQKAKPSTRFMRIKDGEPAPVKTEIRAIAAEGKVFFAVRCEEPKLDAMKLSVREQGSPSIWTNDSVELFLDVERKAASYFHLMVNADGFAYGGSRGATESEGIPVKAKAGRSAGGWTVELAVPVKALGAKITHGTRWGFHVCRNRYPESGTYVWTWTGGSNHNPQRYGTLAF